jgi:hypothetical protein
MEFCLSDTDFGHLHIDQQFPQRVIRDRVGQAAGPATSNMPESDRQQAPRSGYRSPLLTPFAVTLN